MEIKFQNFTDLQNNELASYFYKKKIKMRKQSLF